MKNPCDICIIKVCCTTVCEPKYEYMNRIISNLTLFSNEYIYDEYGNKKQNLYGIVKLKYDHMVDLCQKNLEEIQSIFNRRC